MLQRNLFVLFLGLHPYWKCKQKKRGKLFLSLVGMHVLDFRCFLKEDGCLDLDLLGDWHTAFPSAVKHQEGRIKQKKRDRDREWAETKYMHGKRSPLFTGTSHAAG